MAKEFTHDIPMPDEGKIMEKCYNAGPMLSNDKEGFTAEDSIMKIVSDVSESGYRDYLDKLRRAGYSITNENEQYGDLFAEAGEMHIAYRKKRGEIRVIRDAVKTPLDEFSYTASGGNKTTVYQYGLYYDKANACTKTTINCGMFYIIRLCDGGLVMIDGGHRIQWSNEAFEGLWEFLCGITGNTGRVRIAAWYFTHAHDDHTDGCTRLLRAHGAEIDLERVMFNFPSYKTVRGSYSDTVFDMKKTVAEMYPKAKLLKVHSGQKIRLADADFEFIYTHEDAVNADDPEKFPPRDFNCTSSVVKFTVGGKSIMFLGDTNVETEAILAETTERELWKSDFVQVAHHCFNYLDTLYEWIDAPMAMLPNSYFGGHTPENTPKLEGVLKHLSPRDNIYYEGEGTYGFEPAENGWRLTYSAPVIGGEYDGAPL